MNTTEVTVVPDTTELTWKYRIVDFELIPRDFLIPNEKMLAAYARSSGAQSRLAGVEFYSEPCVAVSGYRR